jgi:tetratricopeptide (TPR) repeat protein
MMVPALVLVRFQRWDDILAAPFPDQKRATSKATWHFARALAYLARDDRQKAERERQAFLACKQAIPADAMVSVYNTSQSVLGIPEAVLEAKFALSRRDYAQAVSCLRQAEARERSLQYAEPPEWIIPVRESLGAVLMAAGQPAEAEKVFRAELATHARSGRSLFGLRESLKAQKRDYAARLVDQEFQAAWKNADRPELRLEDCY